MAVQHNVPWQRVYTFLQADDILLARSTSPELHEGGECAGLWRELIERSSNSPISFFLLPTVRNAGRFFMRRYFDQARKPKINRNKTADDKALQGQSPTSAITHLEASLR